MYKNLATRHIARIALLMFLLSSPVYASSGDGLKAAEMDDYKTAFKKWFAQAKNGNPSMQATIAVLYHAGQGVKQDYKQAFYWYKKAAERGNSAAQVNLGVMYAKGTGTRQNLIESYAWYSVAAVANTKKKLGNQIWGIDAVSAQLSKAELAKAKQLASQYQKKYNVKK